MKKCIRIIISLCLIIICISCGLVSKLSSNSEGYEIYTSQDYTLNDLSKLSFRQAALPLNDPQVLVVPVLFSDSNLDNKDEIYLDIVAAFDEKNDKVFYENVSSYYFKLSYGRTRLNRNISDWFVSDKPAKYFGNDDKNLSRTLDLTNEICDALSLDERQKYDSDNDGYIDSLIMIYNFHNYKKLLQPNMSNLWAYCYWNQNEADIENPRVNAFMWASYDFMYDGAEGELDCRTYIHEVGHLFGLDDYYDYSNQYRPAGGWGRQDENVGSHDPYSRLLLGWYRQLYLIKDTCSFSRETLEDGDIAMICPDYNNSPFNEYYLIDVYSPTSLNAYDVQHKYISRQNANLVNAYGFRIWHVDSRLVSYKVKGDHKEVLNDIPFSRLDRFTSYSNIYPIIGNTNTSVTFGRQFKHSYIGDNFRLLELVKDKEADIIRNNRYFAVDDLFRDNSSYTFFKLPNTGKEINLAMVFSIKDGRYNISVRRFK